MKKLLMLLALSFFGIAIAQDAPAPAAPPKDKPGQRPDRANMRNQMMERQRKRLEESIKGILAAYDKNQDGKLDEAEKAAMKEEFAKIEKIAILARDYRIIERIDENGDFVLTPEEFEKIPQAFGREGGMRPPRGGGMRPPHPPRGGNRPGNQPPPPKPEQD